MSQSHLQARADRRVARVRRNLVDQLCLLVGDSGVTVRQLGEASGLTPQYVARVLAGTERPTLEAYARLAEALGADLHCRFYPNTGPAIHDRHQAPILEFLLGARHRRWEPHVEPMVHRPSRGWIDLAHH
jgi:transcriptional regulator with XRE-family HTH domain